MLNKRESQYEHFHIRDVSTFLLACSFCILFEIVRVDKEKDVKFSLSVNKEILLTLDSLSDHHRRL